MFGFKGLGFRFHGLGVSIYCLKFRGQGSGFRVQGSEQGDWLKGTGSTVKGL